MSYLEEVYKDFLLEVKDMYEVPCFDAFEAGFKAGLERAAEVTEKLDNHQVINDGKWSSVCSVAIRKEIK